MNELFFQYLGSPLFFQTGFSREVESVQGWAMDSSPNAVQLFSMIPAGPLLVETTSTPAQVTGGDIQILESTLPEDLGAWLMSLTYPQYAQEIMALRTRTVTIPPSATFRQFINVNGPFVAINYDGADWLNLQPAGLIPWAPSSMNLGSVGIVRSM
jgi:hypothetical protein